MRAIIILLCAALLLGCLGGGEPPAQNQTNQTPEKNQTPIGIIIDPQTNQTVGENETDGGAEPPPPIGENETGLGYEYAPEEMLGVFFIDVGGFGPQGDAILIKKGDLDILVDAGPAESSGKVVDFLRSHDVDDIEVLISTNADPRHYGGINAVLENFLVEELWWTDDSFGDPDYSAAIERVSDQAKDVRVVRDGFTAMLNGINLTAINPPKEDRDRFDDVNNDAIVMRVQDRNFSMLLTSGIQTGAQGLLLNTRKSLMAAEIVQAPYYGVGSGTSNIGIFLINLKPKIIIISGSGDESAQNGGSRDPFKRQMGMYNITYYENYKNGTIRVTSDGSSYIIQSLGRGQ